MSAQPPHRRSRARRAVAAVAAAATLGAPLLAAAPASAAPSPRVLLRVLVVSDGSPWTEALANQLDRTGVPYTRVSPGDAGRPTVDASFLVRDGAAQFQAVVLPNTSGGGLSAAEMSALAAYEATYGVREVDGYNWPGAAGLVTSFAGSLDGAAATVTPEAKAAGFGYLRGALTIDDVDPGVSEVFGYLASPPATPGPDESYTPFLQVTQGTSTGSVATVHRTGSRERLVLTAAFNSSMQWFDVLAPGVVEWMTRGVHLGLQRNAFAVHIDDVFLPDSRWSTSDNCTPGDGCVDPTVTTPDIRMTAADVTRLVAFQKATGFRLDLVFNGGGSDAWRAAHGGRDRLADALLAAQARFPWINHTSTHPYLGCIQVAPTVQGQSTSCATTPDAAPRQDPDIPQAESGGTYWASQEFVTAQVADNIAWATARGLTDFDRTELVTGEHSGLKSLPQQPTDNPFLAPALAATGIRTIASDASREADPRAVGAATTVPRHPMNIYYNTATYAEQIDEYNWYYTRAADGGGGICEANPATSTCIAPLAAGTPEQAKASFDSYLAPLEVRNALRFVLANDPRPFYAHQSNLAEDGILYPVVRGVLDRYAALYDTASTPLVRMDMTGQSLALSRMASWKASTGTTAWVDATGVHVRAGGAAVPLTVPAGTTAKGASLSAYAGSRSGWVPTALNGTLPLPAGGYAGLLQTPGAPALTAAAPGDASATVGWTAPTATGSGPVLGYLVRAFAGDPVTPAAVVEVPDTARTATVSGLVNGTAYTFEVAARNLGGTGAPSARSAPVVPAAPVAPVQPAPVQPAPAQPGPVPAQGAPSAPQSPSAVPGDASASVSWTAPDSSGGSPLLGYAVRAFDASGRLVSATAVAAGSTAAKVSGLVNGRPYTFDVLTANRNGVSPASVRSPAVTPAADPTLQKAKKTKKTKVTG